MNKASKRILGYILRAMSPTPPPPQYVFLWPTQLSQSLTFLGISEEGNIEKSDMGLWYKKGLINTGESVTIYFEELNTAIN